MTEDAGQNYLILMETICIYLFIQIDISDVCVCGGGGGGGVNKYTDQLLGYYKPDLHL